MHHIWIFISRTVAPNLENGETGDYVAWLDASGQITRGKESSAPVLIPAIPSLILNPVGPCQPNSRTPKATWAAETAVSPPTFLSFFYEREIYISRVQPMCTQAAEFAHKSTMQNYCPHTSFPRIRIRWWRIAFAASARHPMFVYTLGIYTPAKYFCVSIQSSLYTYFHWFRWVHVISILFMINIE